MARDTINLLPQDRIRTARQAYFFRLATVALITLALVVVAHGLLLLPSYMLVSTEVRTKEAELAALTTTQGAAKEQEASAQITALTADATYLARLGSIATASAAVRAVLGVSRAGISLTSISFSPPGGSGNGKMQLTGSATTRETLRSFQAALGKLPFVANVDLPIGAFAKDSDLPFTITLTGSFKS